MRGYWKSANRSDLILTLGIGSLWNPLLIILSGIIRGFTFPLDLNSYLQLIPTAVVGLFLYYAVKAIHFMGRKKTAIVAFVILAPITCIFSITGGLFGPIGIILYGLVPGIPAWVILWIIRWRETGKQTR